MDERCDTTYLAYFFISHYSISTISNIITTVIFILTVGKHTAHPNPSEVKVEQPKWSYKQMDKKNKSNSILTGDSIIQWGFNKGRISVWWPFFTLLWSDCPLLSINHVLPYPHLLWTPPWIWLKYLYVQLNLEVPILDTQWFRVF